MRLLLLGLQFAIVSAMYLVLVVIVLRHARVDQTEGVNILSMACIALAIGTVLQALRRGPIGSGFLAPPVFSAVYLGPSVLAAERGGMPLVVGMTLCAALVEVALGLAIVPLRRLITPALSGLTVFLVGLELGIVGIGEVLDIAHRSMPAYPLHLAVTTTTVLTCVGLSIWGRGTWKLMCTLCGLVVGLTAAGGIGIVGSTEIATIVATDWVPHLAPPRLGFSFDLGFLPAFIAAGLAAGVRAVGVITTCQRLNDADWRRPDMANIRRGVIADGLSNLAGGLLGAPGMSIGPSLVGISAAIGATSRAIAYAASGSLLIIGLLPKVCATFLVIPPEVAGSVLVFTACFMITGGMEIMLSRPVGPRGVYIIGIATLVALSVNVFPAYYSSLPMGLQEFVASPLAPSLAVALLLTALLRLGTRQRARIAWNASPAAMTAAIVELSRKLQEWKSEANAGEGVSQQVKEVMDYLIAHSLTAHGATPPAGALQLSFDGTELRADISIRWHPTFDAAAPYRPQTRQEAEPAKHSLNNEEATAFAGLVDFLHGLVVDRQKVSRTGDDVRISLFYVS